MNIFEAHKVSKSFADHLAVDKVSLSVPQGSIYGFLGPNGAGKTTLLRIINQITGPDEGQMFFKGENLRPEHVVHIGYLPEERGLYKKMKVGEQAIYLSRLKGLSKADALTKVKFWFEKFDIMPWWNRKIEELSKGMQQKIQFIITVLHEPELLIFDEPFSGFDPINVNLLKNEILELKDKGTSIIFSTHNMESVEELCDNISLINSSKKILEGKVSDLKQQYKKNVYKMTGTAAKENILPILQSKTTVVDAKEKDGLSEIIFNLSENSSAMEVMQSLPKDFNLQSFTEILPSMNDIFIQAVDEHTGKTNQAHEQ